MLINVSGVELYLGLPPLPLKYIETRFSFLLYSSKCCLIWLSIETVSERYCSESPILYFRGCKRSYFQHKWIYMYMSITQCQCNIGVRLRLHWSTKNCACLLVKWTTSNVLQIIDFVYKMHTLFYYLLFCTIC